MRRPATDLPEVRLLGDEAPPSSSDDLIGEASPRARWPWLAAGVVVLAAMGAVGSVGGGSSANDGPVTDAPERTHMQTGLEGDPTPALTPDGVPEGVLGPFVRSDDPIAPDE